MARMLVSCPVSCNQCKNKCDDNNVYCKVGRRQGRDLIVSGMGGLGGVQEEHGLHEHLLCEGNNEHNMEVTLVNSPSRARDVPEIVKTRTRAVQSGQRR